MRKRGVEPPCPKAIEFESIVSAISPQPHLTYNPIILALNSKVKGIYIRIILIFVRLAGFEPAQVLPRYVLSVVCLPFHHRRIIYFGILLLTLAFLHSSHLQPTSYILILPCSVGFPPYLEAAMLQLI